MIGEALLALKDIPLVSGHDKRNVKHQYINLTRPSKIQGKYKLFNQTPRAEILVDKNTEIL